MVLALAEEVGQVILSPTEEAGMRRLDRDDHNIRAAIEWSLAAGEPALGLRIMGSIWRWFQQRGRLREGRAILAQLFARVRTTKTSASGSVVWLPKVGWPTGSTTSPDREWRMTERLQLSRVPPATPA